jgi:hypothetical protein
MSLLDYMLVRESKPDEAAKLLEDMCEEDRRLCRELTSLERVAQGGSCPRWGLVLKALSPAILVGVLLGTLWLAEVPHLKERVATIGRDRDALRADRDRVASESSTTITDLRSRLEAATRERASLREDLNAVVSERDRLRKDLAAALAGQRPGASVLGITWLRVAPSEAELPESLEMLVQMTIASGDVTLYSKELSVRLGMAEGGWSGFPNVIAELPPEHRNQPLTFLLSGRTEGFEFTARATTRLNLETPNPTIVSFERPSGRVWIEIRMLSF